MRIVLFVRIVTVSFVLFLMSGCVSVYRGAKIDCEKSVSLPSAIMDGTKQNVERTFFNAIGKSANIKIIK